MCWSGRRDSIQSAKPFRFLRVCISPPDFFSRAARNDSVVPRLKNRFPAAAAAAHFSIRRRSSLINVPALSHFLLIDTGNDDWCD
jgi:hypothetical protein